MYLNMALQSRIKAFVGPLPTLHGRLSRASVWKVQRGIQTISQDDAKPFSEMPGPSAYNPLTYWNLFSYMRRDKLHEFNHVLFEKFGPVVKNRMGKANMVTIHQPQDIETLYRHESRFPSRFPIEAWKQFRQDTNRADGIVTSSGTEWKRMRKVIEQTIMKPKTVLESTEALNDVTTDLIQKLLSLRDVEGGGKYVPKLNEALFYWSLESIGVLLYEERFGCLKGKPLPEMTAFVRAVRENFDAVEKLAFVPYRVAKYIMPRAYNMHYNAHDTLFRIGGKILDRKLADIEATISRGEEVKGFLSHLVAGKGLTLPELHANVTEMMTASVDTTSNTMQFALHELACNPQVQGRLYREITSIIPSNEELKQSHIPSMHYVRAVIKETLRMHPVAYIMTRIIDKDVVLGGYWVPAGTVVAVFHYGNGRNPKFYEDPDAFKPERWLRDSTDRIDKTGSFASLPFGFGPRGCVGRRIAELEMQILLTRICRQFHLKPTTQEPLEVVSKFVLQPKNPVCIQMIERDS